MSDNINRNNNTEHLSASSSARQIGNDNRRSLAARNVNHIADTLKRGGADYRYSPRLLWNLIANITRNNNGASYGRNDANA